jgi:hypothetical protein
MERCVLLQLHCCPFSTLALPDKVASGLRSQTQVLSVRLFRRSVGFVHQLFRPSQERRIQLVQRQRLDHLRQYADPFYLCESHSQPIVIHWAVASQLRPRPDLP